MFLTERGVEGQRPHKRRFLFDSSLLNLHSAHRTHEKSFLLSFFSKKRAPLESKEKAGGDSHEINTQRTALYGQTISTQSIYRKL
jgi:hypothetical protein